MSQRRDFLKMAGAALASGSAPTSTRFSWPPSPTGAHGVLLSRKYSEMRLANLSGAGEAIKEAGAA